jgi:ankyrin repeat protein
LLNWNDNNSPLLYCFKRKEFSFDLCKLLVERECKVNSLDKRHNNLLHLECEKENPNFDVIKFLVENKCNASHVNDEILGVYFSKNNLDYSIVEFLTRHTTKNSIYTLIKVVNNKSVT